MGAVYCPDKVILACHNSEDYNVKHHLLSLLVRRSNYVPRGLALPFLLINLPAFDSEQCRDRSVVFTESSVTLV
jgi:hypothetical protein